MTGATSTTGGGGGAEARTLPVLQPSAFSEMTAPTNAVNICLIVSFPSILITLTSLQSRHRRARTVTLLGCCVRGGPMVVLSIQARQSRDYACRPNESSTETNRLCGSEMFPRSCSVEAEKWMCCRATCHSEATRKPQGLGHFDVMQIGYHIRRGAK